MSSKVPLRATLFVALILGTADAVAPAAKEPAPRRIEASQGVPSQTEPSLPEKPADKADASPRAASTTPPNPLPAQVTTSHAINLPGRGLRFKAIAGAIRLSDAQTGTPEADVGFVAFLLEGADTARRPITFAINGGPGAASAWLNLGAMGPWRLPLDGASPSASAPAVTIDNAETWLDFTDLVFIDPPGTGYSRLLAKGEDARRHFYSVKGDIEALAVVIRKWLAANDRLTSPKFIVGESYGGFRAPKLARRLRDVEGIGVRGLILVSPVLDFGWFEGAANPLTFVARLPSQAAAARDRGGGEGRAGLADVEAYAAGPYLVDLLRGERDAAAVARLSENVASFTGLDPALVKKFGGRIDVATFARERTRMDATVTSLYDARASGFDPAPHAASSDYGDPILDAVKAPLASAMANLSAKRLGWPIEARYEILNESVNRNWDWSDGRGRVEALGDLKQVMALDPLVRVLIVHGATDMVTPYFASKLLIDQVPTFGDPDRLRLEVHPGGHMLYFDDKSRAAFREDARRLIEGE